MMWVKDWPVIGIDTDGDGKGEPVQSYKKPSVGKSYPVETPIESDEFDSREAGLQWQWHANPEAEWMYTNSSNGTLRLYSVQVSASAKNLWDVPNLLLQKFPSDKFSVSAKITFRPNTTINHEKVGLLIMGLNYAYVGVRSSEDGLKIVYSTCTEADKGKVESEIVLADLKGSTIYFKVDVAKNAVCQFSYSIDGKKFTKILGSFTATPGKWIGAKIGLFCIRKDRTNDAGYADVDWFRIGPID
jgi:beta-xylosidase